MVEKDTSTLVKVIRPEVLRHRAIKCRAKKTGIPFDLCIEDLISPDVCPILGVHLQRGKGHGPQPYSPSVDRIDPTLGYIKGNIQIVSQRANVMKNNATPEELREFAKWVIKTYGLL